MAKRRKYLLQGILLVLAVLTVTLGVLAADNKATVMQMEKTEGSVNILDSKEKTVPLIKRMRLYHGYQLDTMEESYAWINLDSDKLIKLDAVSEAGIRKSGRKLEVLLDSGNLFFNVSKPLEDDESMTIRTSTMAVGVRGTCGWVEITDENTVRVTVLEGTVTVSVTDPVTGEVKTERISGGETAVCMVYGPDRDSSKCEIIRNQCTREEIRGFVLIELFPDAPLREKIYEESGIDLRDLTEEEARKRLREDEEGIRTRLAEIADARKGQEESASVVQVWTDRGGGNPGSPALGTSAGRRLPGTTGTSGNSGTSGTPNNLNRPWISGKPGTPDNPNTPDTSDSAVREIMMPLTDVQVQKEINQYSKVYIQKNPAYADNGAVNTLLIDSGLAIPAGKTLTMASGIRTNVAPRRSLQVDGTMDMRGSLDNQGMITVTSFDTLRIGRELYNTGRLTVSATGRVVAEGSFISEGTLSLTQGAVVQARTFNLVRAVRGWMVSETVNNQGYYRLVYNGEDPATPDEPQESKRCKVTFDPNGGTLSEDDEPSREVWSGDSLNWQMPYAPSHPEYHFSGWYTEAEGGTKVTSETVITGDMTVYAHWDIIKFSYDAATKTLTISGDGVMKDYEYTDESWSAPWSSYQSEIETVIIEKGVTGIGGAAFYKCSNLARVVIPEGMKSVGYSAFRDCRSLGSVTLPAGVTIIGNAAFYDCSGLGSVTLSEGITSIGYAAFSGCSSLGSITLPKGVTSIEERAFYNCSSLGSITIPAEVTNISRSTFYGCTSLSSVTLPEGVAEIGDSAFYNCTSLSNITLPKGVTKIGVAAFANCSNLSSVVLSEGVTSIGRSAFYGCSKLADFKIPEGVTSIGRNAFYGCSSLTGIAIPKGVTRIEYATFVDCSGLASVEIPETVTSIGDYTFANCKSLAGVDIPENVTRIGEKAFGSCTSLSSITMPKLITSIADEAFTYCTKLTSVQIPDGVTSIGSRAFSSCSNLSSVTIPDGVTDIGDGAFSYCGNLGSITIPSGVTSIGYQTFASSGLTGITIPGNVTSIDIWAFANCSKLASINISNGVTDIGNYAFMGCKGLTRIEIPESVKSIGNSAFSSCSSLADIAISAGVTGMNIGSNAFAGCNMTSITLPDGITVIGDGAFSGCGNLAGITLPSGITSIGRSVFERCGALTSITIPAGVTSIGSDVFKSCDNLTSITIPAGVTRIDSSAFLYCNKLTHVYFGGTEEAWKGLKVSMPGYPEMHYESSGP